MVQVLVSAFGLTAFGVTGAVLGGAGVLKGGTRVLVGGLVAMGITYGFGRLFKHGSTSMP
jgi:VIT1/CCC1 family predicted Fe2+/Mn2+ transporter